MYSAYKGTDKSEGRNLGGIKVSLHNLPPNNNKPNNEWQTPTRKHTIDSKKQSTTPKSSSTPTKNKYKLLSSILTPDNITKSMEDLHRATDKRPTKEHK